jgi:hypothetical protein
LGKGLGVDLVGLDLGVANSLQILRVGELEVHAFRREQVGDPVPARGRLDGSLVRTVSVKGSEVLAEPVSLAGQLLLPGDGAILINGGEVGGALVQVDARVVGCSGHGRTSFGS